MSNSPGGIKRTCAQDFAAFDSLPAPVRTALNYAPANLSCEATLVAMIQGASVPETVDLIDRSAKASLARRSAA